jgi:hypothetical protein
MTTTDMPKAALAGDWIVLGAADQAHADALADAAREVVGVREVRGDAETVRVRVSDGPAMVPLLLYGLVAAGLRPRTTELRRPMLDDVFLMLPRRSLRERAEV